MAARDRPLGVDHPTVVPSNLEEESEECPCCGEQSADH